MAVGGPSSNSLTQVADGFRTEIATVTTSSCEGNASFPLDLLSERHCYVCANVSFKAQIVT